MATRSKASIKAKAPADGAVLGSVPDRQEPQLCTLAEEPPDGDGWVSEIKFDGYRFLAALDGGKVRLLTRNGHDWAARLPAVVQAIGRLSVKSAMLDGELVSLRADGVSSFPGLQSALKTRRDDTLFFYCFDLLHLDGWDLRRAALLERKRLLKSAIDWTGMLKYSDHVAGDAHAMHHNACQMHLEGIVCKQTEAPYRSGRGTSWIKVKCSGREELIVLGWTPPHGSRIGIGALHVGYYDPDGKLHYAGGVGSGLDDSELRALRERLGGMQAEPPVGLLVAGDPIDASVIWVRPEIVIEVQYTDWSGAGRVRHPVFLGFREDKSARQVVRNVADPELARVEFELRRGRQDGVASRKAWHGAIPPLRRQATPELPPVSYLPPASTRRPARRRANTEVCGVRLSHPDKELWPGVTKQELAEYWQAVAAAALPGIARRPLSILRCPDGINGTEQFFQKNGLGIMPPAVREGLAKQPFLAIDDVEGLISLAQMSAIELHAWGSLETDPTRPERMVFDLDPGEGVTWSEVVKTAHEVRERLRHLNLTSFCRTTGGKGLHVVVPLKPQAEWGEVKPFCRAFAELMAKEEPARFVAHLKIADRRGRILVDWLRNGLGSTAVASFSPRARPGATVATPVTWKEVTPKLDPSAFTVRTVPGRLRKLKADAWDGFAAAGQELPELVTRPHCR